MTGAQAKLWRDVVETEPASFRADLQRLIDRVSIEKILDPETEQGVERMLRLRNRETKALVSLATRLRLTNQARYTASAAGTEARNMSGGSKPWETDPADDYFKDADDA